MEPTLDNVDAYLKLCEKSFTEKTIRECSKVLEPAPLGFRREIAKRLIAKKAAFESHFGASQLGLDRDPESDELNRGLMKLVIDNWPAKKSVDDLFSFERDFDKMAPEDRLRVMDYIDGAVKDKLKSEHESVEDVANFALRTLIWAPADRMKPREKELRANRAKYLAHPSLGDLAFALGRANAGFLDKKDLEAALGKVFDASDAIDKVYTDNEKSHGTSDRKYGLGAQLGWLASKPETGAVLAKFLQEKGRLEQLDNLLSEKKNGEDRWSDTGYLYSKLLELFDAKGAERLVALVIDKWGKTKSAAERDKERALKSVTTFLELNQENPAAKAWLDRLSKKQTDPYLQSLRLSMLQEKARLADKATPELAAYLEEAPGGPSAHVLELRPEVVAGDEKLVAALAAHAKEAAEKSDRPENVLHWISRSTGAGKKGEAAIVKVITPHLADIWRRTDSWAHDQAMPTYAAAAIASAIGNDKPAMDAVVAQMEKVVNDDTFWEAKDYKGQPDFKDTQIDYRRKYAIRFIQVIGTTEAGAAALKKRPALLKKIADEVVASDNAKYSQLDGSRIPAPLIDELRKRFPDVAALDKKESFPKWMKQVVMRDASSLEYALDVIAKTTNLAAKHELKEALRTLILSQPGKFTLEQKKKVDDAIGIKGSPDRDVIIKDREIGFL